MSLGRFCEKGDEPSGLVKTGDVLTSGTAASCSAPLLYAVSVRGRYRSPCALGEVRRGWQLVVSMATSL
jgi:hypothetical protein